MMKLLMNRFLVSVIAIVYPTSWVLADKKIETNLLVNIVTSDHIFQMTGVNKWTCLSGNPKGSEYPVTAFNNQIAKTQDAEPFYDPKIDFMKKMNESGNLYLVFSQLTRRYHTINKFAFTWDDYAYTPKLHPGNYPKLPTLCEDLSWLCKNKWLLVKLSKGELRLEDYRLSLRQFSLIMRLSPPEWRAAIVAYAVSDKIDDRDSWMQNEYAFILTKSLKPDEAFLEEYPYLEGLNIMEMFYPAIISGDHKNFQTLVSEDYRLLLESLEKEEELSPEQILLATIIFADKSLNEMMLNNFSDLKLLRGYILKHKNITLLKSYLKRLQRRQSVADIPVLGEFLQSDLYLQGTALYRHAIIDQCAIRMEKEVVWLLADSVKLPKAKEDRPIEEIFTKDASVRAKEIMMRFTKKDLGDDPAAWKKWYRDQ